MLAEMEEIRRSLAEKSMELEELRENNKKKMAFQEKEIEETYGDLSTYAQEEKALRVKVNQLENDLELHFKRLDIICKSKGMQRPQRKTTAPENKRVGGGSYVSPYRQGSGARGVSNGSNSN